MLVHFVIDTDSLADDEWSPRTLTSHHEHLLDVWSKIGLLVHDGATFEKSQLRRAVEHLPQHVRKLWTEQLMHLRPAAASGWNGRVSPNALDALGELATLALIDETHALCDFNFADDEGERLVPTGSSTPVDVCLFGRASVAKPFLDAQRLSQCHVKAGETYKAIWQARFRGLARAPIKQISVVDRYAITNHGQCPQYYLSGLVRFLKLLGEDTSSERHVDIYSAWPKDKNEKEHDTIIANAQESIRGLELGSIVHVRLFMARYNVFREAAHDRFVRFGRYVWDLGTGLEIFQGPSNRRRAQATFKSAPAERNEYAEVERELRDAKGTAEYSIPSSRAP